MATATDLKGLADRAVKEISSAADEAALEGVRVRYLSRRDGLISNATKEIAALPASEKPAYGQAVNEAKRRIEAALEERGRALREGATQRSLSETQDLTLPPRRVRVGRLHPISRTIREITRILGSMGFEAVEGPEVEYDYYSFEALNIPRDHPARDKFSSLWIANPLGDPADRRVGLRPHTSPMQIRVMEKRRPPVRVVVPGRCYRYEATDATHESIFFQYEGLAIDEQLSMADLKGVLYSFASQLFGGERKIRFRPDYFPFTEPSAEIAFDCFVCDGSGTTNAGRCATCLGTGWIEAAGCGMVHPEALRRVDYDPSKYQGFAFGGGVERLAMLLTGTPDIRLFHENDMRYLESV